MRELEYMESSARYLMRKFADAISAISPKRGTNRSEIPRRIGILLQWGIGDAVIALPLLQGLREAYPEASIEVIGKSWLAELFAGEEWFERMHVLVPPWSKYRNKYRFWEPDWRSFKVQLELVRKTRFDLLIGLRIDPRELLQMRLLKAKETAGFGSAGGHRWVTRDLGLAFKEYNDVHRTRVATHALEVLTELRRPSTPRFHLPESTRGKALETLRRGGYKSGKILAIHTGAGNPIRRWDIRNFNAVLQDLPPRIAMAVVIHDGSSDDPDPGIRLPESVPNMVWRSGLSDLKGLLSICDFLLCCDSGVMHMAAASGCRVLAVFGPTSKRWFGPCGEGHDVVWVENMPCRPCSDKCSASSPLCMEQIPVVAVSEALARMCAPNPSGTPDQAPRAQANPAWRGSWIQR